MVEIEWQFDALDLRPVERWLSMLPTLSIEADEQQTITALAKTSRRLVDSYLDTADWRMAQAGFVLRTRRRGRHDEVTLKDTKEAEASGLRQRLEVTEVLPADGIGALGQDGPVGRRACTPSSGAVPCAKCCRCGPGVGPSRCGWAGSTRPRSRWTTPS